MASHESSVSRHRRRIVIGRSFLFLPICRNGSIDRERNEGSQGLVVTIMPERAGGMNAFDASYFESSISDTEAQIADPGRDVSVPDFAIEGQLPLSCNLA
jgi:hypothetical protein